MKSNQIVKMAIAGTKMTFSVVDAGEFVFDTADASEANKLRAMFHGFGQKISNAAAIPTDKETGKSATPAMKFDAMKTVADRLSDPDGTWNQGASTEPRGGVLFAALMELYPEKGEVKIREYLDGKTRAQQAALRKTEKIAAKILEIQTRDADGDAGDDMIDELEAL